METNDYQKSVERTAKSMPTQEIDGQTLNVLHWSLGLAGEVGELVDTVKKHVFYGQEFDMANAQEELGDILYYLTAMTNELGLTLDYIMLNNKVKLDSRYPDGYSNEHAKARFDKYLDMFLEQ
jgi:NTP pyrophosphatase (non-canonical NTP hydrolase)